MSVNFNSFTTAAMNYFLTTAGENRGKSEGGTGGWDTTEDYSTPGAVSAKEEKSSQVKEAPKQSAPAPSYEDILKAWEENGPRPGEWY